MLNHIIIEGRLTRDPELKYITNGSAVVNISVCWNKSKKVNEQWESEPHFFNCSCFGKKAEHIESNYKKGNLIIFAGQLEQRRWEDNTGKEQSRTSILIKEVTYKKLGENDVPF